MREDPGSTQGKMPEGYLSESLLALTSDSPGGDMLLLTGFF